MKSIYFLRQAARAAVASILSNQYRDRHKRIHTIEHLEFRTMLAATPAYWNPSGATPYSWDTTSSDWSIGNPNATAQPWSNSGDSNGPFQAMFVSGSGSISVSGHVNVSGMSFSTTGTGYNISGSGLIILPNAGGTINTDAGSNAILGTEIYGGALTKTGTGILTLASHNVYSWSSGTHTATTPTTVVSAGTLQLGNGGTTGDAGSGPISLTSGSNLSFNEVATPGQSLTPYFTNRILLSSGYESMTVVGDPTTLTGIISGSGQVSIGPINGNPNYQVLNLQGDNTYTGATTVLSGSLNVSSGSLDSSTLLVSAGATVTADSGSLDSLNSLDDDGDVILSDPAPGANSLLSPSNPVGLTGSGVLTISGGTLILKGTDSYTGTTNVSNGSVLSLQNTAGSGTGAGNVVVTAGSTLDGTGSTSGSVTVNSGGVLDPGISTATSILEAGSVLFNSGATFNAAINGSAAGNGGGSGYDQLAVSGTVNISSGSILNLSGVRTAGSGSQITIIQNNGSQPVVGNFSGLPNDSVVTVNSVPYLINYSGGDGNNVVLTDLTQPQMELTATAMMDGSITASWLPASIGEAGYFVQRLDPSTQVWSTINATSPTPIDPNYNSDDTPYHFVDPAAASDTGYTYRVQAYSGSASSPTILGISNNFSITSLQAGAIAATPAIGTYTIPVGGTSITSAFLENGVQYEIQASGYLGLAGTDLLADAEWTEWDNKFGTDQHYGQDLSGGSGKPGVNYGIGVGQTDLAGNKYPYWGSYQSSHVYSIVQTGTGHTLSLNFHDDKYSDNVAIPAPNALTITIYQLSVPETHVGNPPFFTSVPVVDAYVGTAYNYQPITAVSPVGESLFYSLLSTNIPAGQLSIANTAGVINTASLSWTPNYQEVNQTYQVVLKVTDTDGNSGTQLFDVVVHPTPGNNPPVIISTPDPTFHALQSTAPLSTGTLATSDPSNGTIQGQTWLDVNGNHVHDNSSGEDLPIQLSTYATPVAFDDNQTNVNRNDDFSSDAITLPFDLNFFGTTYSQIYINNNGNITFGGKLGVYTSDSFPISTAMIAPFWADVDTRPAASGVVEVTHPDTDPDHGINSYGNKYLEIDWPSVGYFTEAGGSTDELDTFSLYIEQSGAGAIIAFVYGDMGWTTGDYSGGPKNAFGGEGAEIGFNAGTVGGVNGPFQNLGRPNSSQSLAPFSNTEIVFKLNNGIPQRYIEPGVDGINVDLVNSTGQTVATQVSHSVDLNNDGIIDPFSEIGVYQFANVPPGAYTVEERSTVGFEQDAPQSPSTYSAVITAGQSITGDDFGNLLTYYYALRAIDPDGDPITYVLNSGPSGATVDPESGDLNWYPPAPGNYAFSVSALDNHGGRDTQMFTVTVDDDQTDIAPIISPIADQNALANAAYTFTPTAIGSNDQELFWDLISHPDGMRIDPRTGEIDWTPTIAQEGVNAVEFRVQDGHGGISLASYNISVGVPTPVDQPSFVSMPSSAVTINHRYIYQATATDPENEPLAFDLPVHPVGMIVQGYHGYIEWDETNVPNGTYQVILRVQNTTGGVALQPFSIVIGDANLSPLITSVPILPAVVGQEWRYQLRGVDPEGDPLTFSLDTVHSSSLLSWDSTTNSVVWTPQSANANQSYTVVVSVSDGNTTTSQNFQLPVVSPTGTDGPTITTSSLPAANENSPYQAQILAVDPNNLPINWSVVGPPSAVDFSIDPQTGILTWKQPDASGSPYSVMVTASDAIGSTSHTYSLAVNTVFSLDEPPVFTSSAPPDAFVGDRYVYQAQATDYDGDALSWSLDKAPRGMVIDPQTGVIAWIPGSDQLGIQNVIVRVVDARGASATQPFPVLVLGISAPPMFFSTPPTQGEVGIAYTYPVIAYDPNGLPLTYTVSSSPTISSLEIDSQTGVLTWNDPTNSQSPYSISITASDGLLSTTQTYSLAIGTDTINLPPIIHSHPKTVADLDASYTYYVIATDPEGNLGTNPYSLLAGPSGMTMNHSTGELSWPNPALGTVMVTIKVADANGAFVTQTYPLSVTAAPPQIVQDASLHTYVGAPYLYYVKVNGGTQPLTYQLSTDAAGMKIDTNGRIAWTADAAGSYGVTVTVLDAANASAQYSYILVASVNTQPPSVSIYPSASQTPIGSTIKVHVIATANVNIASLSLTVTPPGAGSPEAVSIGSDGIASYTVGGIGTYIFNASAVDISGNVGSASPLSEFVIDPSDTTFPTVAIVQPVPDAGGDDPRILAPTAINGTISDVEGISSYSLSAIPEVGGSLIDISSDTFTSDYPTSIANPLGTFDPTDLPNGVYTILLTATNIGGKSRSTEEEVEVDGNFKLGNLSLSFNDLTVPVAGIPITITRSYDSLDAKSNGDFGYGWSIGYGDVKVQTSLVNTTAVQQFGDYPTFQDGTRVWITLPGGKREMFTFYAQPDGDDSNYLQSLGDELLTPTFVPSAGVTDILSIVSPEQEYLSTSDGAAPGPLNVLVLDGSNTGYNPGELGDSYRLTTPDGTVYNLDALTGTLSSLSALSGNSLHFSSTGITATAADGSQLAQVTFNRDPVTGDITSIVDPDGNKILYNYSSSTTTTSTAGDLISVSHQSSTGSIVSSVSLNYTAPQQHFLTKIVDGDGTALVTVNYDPTTGRIINIIDGNGNVSPFTAPTQVPGGTAETTTDATGIPTTNIYDDNGNVVRTIKQFDSYDKSITIFVYNSDNDLLAQSFSFLASGDVYDAEPPSYGTPSNPNALDPNSVISDWAVRNTYDDQGNLITTADGTGRVTENHYGPFGQLDSSTDNAGNTTYYGYNVAGNLTSTTDAEGNVTGYSYNSKGELVEVDSPSATAGEPEQYTAYSYDGAGFETSVTTGHLTNGVHFVDKSTTNTVDADGNVIGTSYVWTNPTPGDGQPATQTVSTTTGYDAAGRVTLQVDADGHAVQSFYNSDGELDHTVDNVAGITSYKYDDAGNLVETDNPNGSEQRTAYDILNRPYLTMDTFDPASGDTARGTETFYDDMGRTTETYRFDGIKIDLTLETNGHYSESVTIPDADTRLSQTDTSYTYFGGWVDNSVVDNSTDSGGSAIGSETRYSYYNNGSQSAVDQQGVPTFYTSSESTNATDLTTSYTYNAAGQQQTVTDPSGHVTTYQYDADGHTTLTTYADGTTISDSYDSLGEKISETDQEGRTTNWKYDEYGHLTEVDQPAVLDAKTGNVATPVTKYTYDAYGNQITQTDADGDTTTFYYDALGRQVGEKLPDVTGKPSASDSTSYNSVGQVTQTVDFDGTTSNYAYYTSTPGIGMVSAIIYSGGGKTTQVVSYTYDTLGRQSTVSDASGITTYHYDSDGNVSEEDTPEGVIHYDYDKTDKLTSTWTANDTSTTQDQAITEIDYSYDILGRLQMATTTRLDSAGTSLTTSYGYDADGNKAYEKLPNGVATVYTYNALNQLTLVVETNAAGATIFSQNFVLNPDGTRHSSHEQQLQSDNSTYVTTDTTWLYDADGRLISEAYTSSVLTEDYTNSFTYDLAGNRMQEIHTVPGGGTDETTTYVYDARNELTSQASSVNGTTTFTYDSNGSQLTSTNGSNVTSYTYDARNKMVTASVNGDATTTYVYDDAGDRVQEATSGTTTYFLTDDSNPSGYAQPIEQWTSTLGTRSNATLAVTYLIGDRIFAQVNSSGDVSYLSVDGHGSTQQETTSSGQVGQAFRYDAFGAAINFNLDTAGTAILFGGDSLYDSSSGLYLHGDGARGRIGFRFIQRDPTGGNDLGPLSLHKYLYAGANPVMFDDPSGHDFGISGVLATTGIGALLGSIGGGAIAGAYKFAKTGSLAAAGYAALEGAEAGLFIGGAAGLGAGLFALGAVAAGATAATGFAAFGITTGIPLLGLSIANLETAYSSGDNVDKAFAWGGLVLSLATLGLSSYVGYSALAAEAGGAGGVAGSATVTQYSGTPLHMVVEVTDGAGNSLATHQVILSADMSSTAIVAANPADLESMNVLASSEVDLPSAGSAIAQQQSLMNAGDLGAYDKFMNSCVSHVCDVLNAGGLPGVPAPGTSTQLKFLLKLVKG